MIFAVLRVDEMIVMIWKQFLGRRGKRFHGSLKIGWEDPVIVLGEFDFEEAFKGG
jgi:hypothetical protein